MNKIITQQVVAVWLGFLILNMAGCARQQDATCPLPQDGVCAPIHVVDATWKAKDPQADNARLHKAIHDTDGGEA